MNFGKMACFLGALGALGLGMGVEACSSSSTTSIGDASTTSTSNGTGCAELTACCATLGTLRSQCADPLATNNSATCSNFLLQIQEMGHCTGITTGTSNTTVSSVTSVSTGTVTTSGTSNTTGSSDGGETTTSSTSGSGSSSGSSSCEKAPSLHVETKAGVYCPYSFVGDAGNLTCAEGQRCCEPASGTATCGTAACATGDTDWNCLAPIDCANASGGKVCCGTGTLATNAACGDEPAYAYVTGFTGTTCAASCTSGTEFIVCEASTDCPSGQTCVATKAKGGQFGHCSTNGM